MNILPLSAYPRPNVPGFGNTRVGFHGTANADLPMGWEWRETIDYMASHGVAWLKLLSRPNWNVEALADYALDKGMGVIVRLYRPEPNPGTLTGEQLDHLRRVAPKYQGRPLYVQFNNEPDLSIEWKGGYVPEDWLASVARDAIADCRAIQGVGLIPVLPPAATGSPGFYQYRLIPKMLELGGSDVFDDKHIVFGVHDYYVGHPVGDEPFYNQPYPLDAVNQSGAPLKEGEFGAFGDVWQAWGHDNPALIDQERAANKNPGQKLMDLGGAASCLATLHQYNLNVKGTLPAPIPVMLLEGGETPGRKDDGRYPRTNAALRVTRHKVTHKRLWAAPDVGHHYAPWLFCTGHWMLHDRHQWPNDGWFNGASPKPEYIGFFEWQKENARNMNYLYEAGGQPPAPVEPVEPEPVEPPEESPEAAERVLYASPGHESILDFLSISEAPVESGGEYWHLAEVRALGPEEGQGRHTIDIKEPRGAGLKIRVDNPADTTTPHFVPLDKPEPEPACNYPMYGIGNTYTVAVEGLPSDTISGLHLPGNLHFVYELSFVKRVKEQGEAPKPPEGGELSPKADSKLVDNVYWVGNYDDAPVLPRESIVVHATWARPEWTPAQTLQATLGWFDNPESGASAHYIIEKSGKIWQCVAENKRAWHAGGSSYGGRHNFNNIAIGIELINANDGRDPYTTAQLKSLVELSKDIAQRHPIKAALFVGHYQISGYRGKTDPKGLNLEAIKLETFGTGGESLEELEEAAKTIKVMAPQPGFALYDAIIKAGRFPISEEFTAGRYVGRLASDPNTKKRYMYYVKAGDWGNVKMKII